MKQKNKEDLYQLWRECFGDTSEFTDFYFEWMADHNEILALYMDEFQDEDMVTIPNDGIVSMQELTVQEENDRLISMLHLNPYQMNIGSRQIPVSYIVGVATKKEYRKQGRMGRLLREALLELYQKGQEFTYLMPADEKIYTPYNFSYVYKQTRVKLDIHLKTQTNIETNGLFHKLDLRTENFLDLQDDMLSIRRLSKEQEIGKQNLIVTLVEYTSNKLSNHFDVFTKRDVMYYEILCEEMISAGGDVLLLYDKDYLIGYLSYMLEGNQAEITECIVEKEYSDSIIKESINFLLKEYQTKKNQLRENQINKKNEDITIDDQMVENQINVDQIIELKEKDNFIITFFDTYFLDTDCFSFIQKYNKEQLIIEQKEYPIIMARIVHVRKFLEAITAAEEISLRLAIKDEIIRYNQGTYELSFSMNGCVISKTQEEPELTLDISELTSVLFGYKTLEEIERQKGNNITKDILSKWNLINHYKKLCMNEII